MRVMFKLGLAMAGLLVVGSCTSFTADGLTYSENMPAVETLGDFEITVTVREWIGITGGPNLFNVTADNMSDPIRVAIQEEIEDRSGDAAINVKVTYESTFLNVLVNGITGGIYAPATATITGTVVTYN